MSGCCSLEDRPTAYGRLDAEGIGFADFLDQCGGKPESCQELLLLKGRDDQVRVFARHCNQLVVAYGATFTQAAYDMQ